MFGLGVVDAAVGSVMAFSPPCATSGAADSPSLEAKGSVEDELAVLDDDDDESDPIVGTTTGE